MLRSVKLKNFKCFGELELECRPLNLLCGLNGMGKSSVIQALLVLRQSFETGNLSSGRLMLAGTRADLGTGSDVLNEDADQDVLGLALESEGIVQGWGLDFGYSETAGQLLALPKDPNSFDELVPAEWQSIPPFGGSLIYVGAERVGPRKAYPLSAILASQGEFGTGSEYAWNFLSQNQDLLLQENDPRGANTGSQRLIDSVDRWLQVVSPGAHVKLADILAADAIVSGFSFDRQGDVESRQHRATNVGFGLSYSLPVILALLSAPGTLCLIENPEAHLHPRGQTQLAELSAKAAAAGVQVFAETHSDHYMDGVRIAVREGVINSFDVAFHYFERKGNQSVVTSPQIERDGRLSSWPSGFFDQHEDNLMRLLNPEK